MISCKKEVKDIVSDKKSLAVIQELQWDDCLPMKISNEQTKEELFTYEHDELQEKTMRANDYLALAIVKVMENNPDIINRIYSFVQNKFLVTGIPQFLFEEYRNQFANDCDIIDEYLLEIMPSGTGSLLELDSLMKWDVDYGPGIYVENYENTNWSLAPIITPGIDVDNEIYGIEGDATYAYYKTGLGDSINEIIIDISIITENVCVRPILVTTHLVKNEDNGSGPPQDTVNCSDCTGVTFGTKFSLFEYKLKTRHERYGNSEVLSNYVHLKKIPNGNGFLFYGLYSSFQAFSFNKNDLNTWQSHWISIADGKPNYFPPVQEISLCNTAFNVVEEDRFNSQKLMISLLAPDGTTKKVFSQRKWTSDWFAFNPSQTNYDYVCHTHQWDKRKITNYNAEFWAWRLD